MLATIAVLATACGSDTSTGSDVADGFIVIDSNGSQLCGALLESYPPQCGDPIVRLGDLVPDAVVALQSPDDASLAPVQWTDYVLGVSGSIDDEVMTGVQLTDPVAEGASDGLIVRVADLGITVDLPVAFPIDITNATDATQPLTFTSGQRAEVTLSQDGEELYRWSSGFGFTAAIEERFLEAGERFGTVITDDPIDLPPGEYDAKAWVTATEAINVVVEWVVTIDG